MNITTKSDITEVTVKMSIREAELLMALFGNMYPDTFSDIVNESKLVSDSKIASLSIKEAYEAGYNWYRAFYRAIGPELRTNVSELSDTPS